MTYIFSTNAPTSWRQQKIPLRIKKGCYQREKEERRKGGSILGEREGTVCVSVVITPLKKEETACNVLPNDNKEEVMQEE